VRSWSDTVFIYKTFNAQCSTLNAQFKKGIGTQSCRVLRLNNEMPKGTRSSRRAGRPTRPGGRRGEAGRSKAGGRSRRKSKFGGKRPGVTHRKGSAKQRKALRVRNKGQNRVRGRQSGGGGKASSFTARPIGRTLGVALAGTTSTEVPVRQRPPGGERGAWGYGKAKPAEKKRDGQPGPPEIAGPAEAAQVNPSQTV